MEALLTKEESLFDSSLFSLDATLTSDQYVDKIVTLLQDVLNSEFSEVPKRKIRVHKDRINFSCPYCGDSVKDIYAKRGNIILLGKHTNHYKCFNCGKFKRVDNFFKDYKKELQLDIINYISSGISDSRTHNHNTKHDASLLMDIELIEKLALDRDDIKKAFNAVEIENTRAKPFLYERLQYQDEKFLYSDGCKAQPQPFIVVLNLTPNKKILGVQLRFFTKAKNKYKTYKLSKIYELISKEIELIPEDIDDMSMLFGITQLNLNQPITLFEGGLDSFLFDNSISLSGANKELPIDLPVRYFFDSDITGKGKSLQMLDKGETVFLWGKFLQDNQFPYRPKWDLNDVIRYIKDNNIQFNRNEFNKYFTNDPLNGLDI